MLNIYKDKGVSLIELMVAVGLGLILILSMLAFYSISLHNVTSFQVANNDQQHIRKIMNLLEANIENTGGFECAPLTSTDTTNYRAGIFSAGTIATPDNDSDRYPNNIISLGKDPDRKQIMFVHPIADEYQNKALGLIDINKTNDKIARYHPPQIQAGCGQNLQSPIFIGSTIFEIIPITGIISDIKNNKPSVGNDITAFVSLAAIQSRRDNSGNIIDNSYAPSFNDATVMFLSNNQNSPDLPFGRVDVDIFLGFSPADLPATGGTATNTPSHFTHIPDIPNMTNLTTGGWINPFKLENGQLKNFDLLTNDSDGKKSLTSTQARSINTALHTDSNGKKIETYPLNKNALKQIRAIKFQFNFAAHNNRGAYTITRVIRFKNTHLMKLEK